MRFKQRPRDTQTYQRALQAGLSPLLAGILASRLVDFTGDIDKIIKPSLQHIDRPDLLKDCAKGAHRVAAAIAQRQRIGILTDYDVDGVTSHALIQRALTTYFDFPAELIDNLIGHRMNDGYGVSERLTDRILAKPERPAVIITADCGSSDEARLARFKQTGIDVIVTDHHALPVEGPPSSAHSVVNPTQADCRYPDATIAGCMTAWLLMSQVRAELIGQGYLTADAPKLARELDYVSLGTVADCVSIGTPINRAVVNSGLKRMNADERPCWRAIRALLNKQGRAFTVDDLSFQLGPRINARSRMADPYAALRYLLAADEPEAMRYLQVLDSDNQDRKLVEREMVESAKRQADRQAEQGRATLVIFLREGHPGVQGIVASRLTQAFGRPAIVLCPATEPDQLTGSARGIPELHLRDALQQVADRHPGLLVKFGGHRGAAGLAIVRDRLALLQTAFEEAARGQIGARELGPVIWTDGTLEARDLSLATVDELDRLQPFGREFEAPVFEGHFRVEAARVVGEVHLMLTLRLENTASYFDAVWFRALAAPGARPPLAMGDRAHCAYKLSVNEFRGAKKLRLLIEYALGAVTNP